MSGQGRFLSLALVTVIGVAGGVYSFKPYLDAMQREKNESQLSVHDPEKGFLSHDISAGADVNSAELHDPSDASAKAAAEADSPGAATAQSGKGT